MTSKQTELPFEQISFQGDQTLGSVEDLRFDANKETIWATIEQMAQLFGKKPEEITQLVRHMFETGELDEATVINKLRTQHSDGSEYSVIHYNLDVILAVGYRVSSKQATALQGLAAEVRRLRTREQNIYKAVRDCFASLSIDYNPKSNTTKSFFAKLQDKFIYAITGQTASQIILDRANGLSDLMGLTATKSGTPTKQDAKTSKNYLNSQELYTLHLLCEQFLLFVESAAIRGRHLTMTEMSNAFDDLIRVQGYPLFKDYEAYLKARAMQHAEKEFQVYKQRRRLENKSKK